MYSRRSNPHNLWSGRTFPNKDITLHVPKDCSSHGICGTVYKPGIGTVNGPGITTVIDAFGIYDSCDSNNTYNYGLCKACLDKNAKTQITIRENGKDVKRAKILVMPEICDKSCVRCDMHSRRPNPHNLWSERTFPNTVGHKKDNCSKFGQCGTVYRPRHPDIKK
jgi:hypothetical protein